MDLELLSMSRFSRFIWFLIMIVIGGGAGLYYAWYVKPAEFVDAALFNLRSDYKTDYVLMVAEIYDKDHDRLHAFMRLDELLASGNETRESVVEDAIKQAEGFGYAPVDLQKMYHLQEVITGEKTTPTPTHDLTRELEAEQTQTAAAQITPEIRETSTPTPNADGAPVAEEDPFNVGVQITTDPNAVPMLNLPAAPTITPPGGWSDVSTDTSGSGIDDYFNDSFGFGGF